MEGITCERRGESRDRGGEVLADGGGRDDVRMVARATYGVGLTAIIMGVWLLMGSVAAATWILNRWNRWWVWGAVSVVFVLPVAAALELITIVEEF